MVGAVPHRVVILYGVGGLSDVGRHAILAAIERPVTEIEHVTVLTRHPQLVLDERSSWNSACPESQIRTVHDAIEKGRVTIVSISSWTTTSSTDTDDENDDTITPHFARATAVISALGNRQPFFGHYEATDGNAAVIRAMMKQQQLKRVVVCSSAGIEEDWPPLEFFPLGRYALSAMFMTCSRRGFMDLTTMERNYKATNESDIDYLFVRPVGLGETIQPVNRWVLQQTKHVDKLGEDMAKLDCARYMVQEAIHPTRHRGAVVIGATVENIRTSST